MKTTIRLSALLLLAALSACTIIRQTLDNQQAQSVTGASGSSIDNAEDPACKVQTVELGTVGDATNLDPGGSAIKTSITLFGQQNLELLDSCRAKWIPTFALESSPSPEQCALSGGGFDTGVRARLAAPPGTQCTLTARAGGVSSNEVVFDVVAP